MPDVILKHNCLLGGGELINLMNTSLVDPLPCHCYDCCVKSPVQVGGHGDLVVPNNESCSEQLIGNPVSRVIGWLELKSDVIQLLLLVPHPQHQVNCSLVLREVLILRLKE